MFQVSLLCRCEVLFGTDFESQNRPNIGPKLGSNQSQNGFEREMQTDLDREVDKRVARFTGRDQAAARPRPNRKSKREVFRAPGGVIRVRGSNGPTGLSTSLNIHQASSMQLQTIRKCICSTSRMDCEEFSFGRAPVCFLMGHLCRCSIFLEIRRHCCSKAAFGV